MGDAPQEIYAPNGMIGPEERRCYFWLGKHWLSGRGCVVDAGAFLGASTLCFAAGAAAGGNRDLNGAPLVHAFDYFSVIDAYVGEAISRDFRPIAEGESYLDIFEAQTQAYADLIRAYPGDFLNYKWDGTPIEVLFIDIAKTSDLCAHAVAQFFPSLIPGRSILIHQDYFHCWHPYIHVGMEYLNEEFELVDEYVHFQSRVWRLAKPIPAEKIARLAAYDFTREERISLLDRLVERSSPFSRPMVEITRLWQMCLDEEWDAAKTEAERLRAYYAIRPEEPRARRSWYGPDGHVSWLLNALRRGRSNGERGIAGLWAQLRHWRIARDIRWFWIGQLIDIEAKQRAWAMAHAPVNKVGA